MDRTMILIGAGRGLGNAVAREFASHGFRVVLVARNEERLRDYVNEFRQQGFKADFKVADAFYPETLTKAIQETAMEYGTPDALVYNVGITVPDGSREITSQLLMERYQVDAASAYHSAMVVATAEFAEKKGAIIFTGGGLALQPYIDYLPLSMDKAALRAMVQALAPSLNEKGIYIGTIQITGRIGSNDHFAPKTIAEKFWELYSKRETNEIVY